MAEDDLVYVARDPDQPGTAWAARIIENTPECFRTLADWAKRGGVVDRVTSAEASKMLLAWVRPAGKRKPGQRALDL